MQPWEPWVQFLALPKGIRIAARMSQENTLTASQA